MSQEMSFEATTSHHYDFKPSFTLIAIDTHKSMFTKLENDQTAFELAIGACYEIVDSLILQKNIKSWTPFCIVLALEDSKATLIDFNQNILESIKLLKKESLLSGNELEKKYERQSDLDMATFFLYCRKRFQNISTNYYKRNMIYITNDDNPIRNDQEKFAVLNEVKNFEGNDIHFEMITTNDQFNYELFYNELFSLLKHPISEILIEDGEGMIDKLSSAMISKYYKRRFNFYPCINRPKMYLKVLQKNFVSKQKLYNNAHISKDGKKLKKISKILTDSFDPQIKYKLKFNLESIEFDVDEYIKMRESNLKTGYTLIVPSDRITDVGFTCKKSILLYPDPKEELPFFNDFWQYCVDNDKVLICARKIKHLDKIRFVEFIPQFDSDMKHFLVKILPSARKIFYPIKQLRLLKSVDPSDEQKNLVKELIDTLTFDYYPKMLPNPSYSFKKDYIKAKLLDEDVGGVEMKDVTSNKDGIDRQIADISNKFNNLFNLNPISTGTKRKATSSKGGRGKKFK